MKLTKEFYREDDVVKLAKELIGKYIFTKIDGKLTGGIITECEAYNGIEDKACHAYECLRTKRTEVMYSEGGVSYVYLCYGIHYLFNVVVSKKDTPKAILIRAFEPTEGIETILKRRKKDKVNPKLTSGSGSFSQALGINLSHNSISLTEDTIWIEDCGLKIKEDEIVSTTRVGIEYAKEDALLPYRFYYKNSKFVSKK